MPTTANPVAASPVSPQRSSSAWLGLLLVLPGLVGCAASQAWPTLQLALQSFQRFAIAGPGEFVAVDNYLSLTETRGFSAAVGFTLVLAAERLVVLAIVPIVLGLAAARAGHGLRLAARLLFTVPLAFFGPVALALAWNLRLVATGAKTLSSPGGALGLVVLLDAAQTLGLAGALGVVAYAAAAWRDTTSTARTPLLVVWLAGLATAIASALQTFTTPYVLTGGGPAASTTTLTLFEFIQGFRNFQFGPAAAAAMLTWLVLAVLGVGITLIVIVTNLQIETHSAGETSAEQAPPLAAVGLLAVGLVVFVLWLLGYLPILLAVHFGGLPDLMKTLPVVQLWLRELLMALAGVLIPLALAYLAALGIGALRPLGRTSEWLLLPFSPWLFVTVAVLMVPYFTGVREADQLGTAGALLPRMLVSVPALVVLTLFFKGRSGPWRAARQRGEPAGSTFLHEVVWPSLPLAALFALVLFAASWQEFLWPLLAIVNAENSTLAVALYTMAQSFRGVLDLLPAGLALLIWPVALVLLVGLGGAMAWAGRLRIVRSP